MAVSDCQTGSAACEDCGALTLFGNAGCQRLFDEVLAREFSDYRYARLHRLTVDCYSLQHPHKYMRSGKSFAAHLTGLCAAIESEEVAAVNMAVRRWLDGPRVVERPQDPPLRHRGALTIVYVHDAADSDQHVQRVREWAHSIWAAWSVYHDLARQWIAQAMVPGPKR
jgi:hypothetical protein